MRSFYAAVAAVLIPCAGEAQEMARMAPAGVRHEEVCAGGVVDPTPGEREWVDATMIRTRAVLPNSLCLARANEYRAMEGRRPLTAVPLSSSDVSAPEKMDAHIVEYRNKAQYLGECEVLVADPGCEALGYTASREEAVGVADISVDDPAVYAAWLPPAVDNSQLPSFPPYRCQGDQGSCASFSSTYYMLTHQTGLARGWDAKNDPYDIHKFTPKWTYNFSNDGQNAGTCLAANMIVCKEQGGALWPGFPYTGLITPSTEYTEWCNDPNVWRDALSYRIRETGFIDIDGPDFVNLKTMLADGNVLVGARAQGGATVPVTDNPASALDDPYAGQWAYACTQSPGAGHAQTIVGYNDYIWCDMNGDNARQPEEVGAFLVYDSYPTGPNGDGINLYAYDSLRAQTEVPGWAPPANREVTFPRKYWVTARASYTPRFMARFTLRHPKRSQARMYAGASLPTQTCPSKIMAYEMLCACGGALGFDGLDYSANPSSAPAYTMYQDLGDLLAMNCPTGLYLGLRDMPQDGYAGMLTNAQIIDTAHNQVFALSPTAVTADGTTVWTGTDYTGPQYTIQASAAAGGAISPCGTIESLPGGAWKFAMTPECYATIADVVVDGVSQGPLQSYTFHDISANHAIHALFSFDTRYVSPSGGNTPPYDSWATAAHSIQDAIDVGQKALIRIGDGTYKEGHTITLGNNIYIKSVNGPARAIVSGENSYACMTIPAWAVVEGLTIRAGDPYGVGLYTGTLLGCVVAQNTGPGVALGDAVCDRCTITGNADGGIRVQDGFFGYVYNCLVSSNSAAQYGGGVYCDGSGCVDIRNCTIAGNSAAIEGGGVHLSDQAELSACNSIIRGNNAPVNPDMQAFDPDYYLSFSYCCAASLLPGTGNIGADPLFLNPAQGDYRLRGDSPCVNAGGTACAGGASDLDGGARICGGTVDMGAYEVGDPVVTSPAGNGIALTRGLSYQFRWRNFPHATVRADLYRGSTFVANISLAEANDGSMTWMVPTTVPTGSNYMIRICTPLKQAPGYAASSTAFAISDRGLPAGRPVGPVR